MTCLDVLPLEIRRAASEHSDVLTGIRLRPEKPLQLEYPDGDKLSVMISREQFEAAVLSLMGHSLYARQNELDEGYFMLPDGSRAGVCGRFAGHGPRSVSDISSVYIRMAREIKGCADGVTDVIKDKKGVLVISPPGKGKTTLLRDIARQLSDSGDTVCIIDERGEIAACSEGIPALDVGMRTDVLTGCRKDVGIMLAIRASAPKVIITDEIGGERDAAAIADAARCGVRIVASAHGYAAEEGRLRPVLRSLVSEGIFDMGVLLGPETGSISKIVYYKEDGSDFHG